MTAMSFISDAQRGHISGSTSYTFAISLAQAERQARCGTDSVWFGAGSEGESWGWESFQAAGARRATWGKREGGLDRSLHIRSGSEHPRSC
jgi:hypothetical protein